MSCAVPGCRMVPSLLPYPLDLEIPVETEGTGYDYTKLRLDLELCPGHAEEVAEAESRLGIALARWNYPDDEDDEAL